MPLVRNRSEVPHRYYDYGRKAYLVWAPGEVKDVPHAVAQQVCQAHPSKMELVLPTPEPEPVETTAEVFEEPTEEPVEVSEDTTDEASDMAEDITEKAVDRAQQGGRRRSTRRS